MDNQEWGRLSPEQQAEAWRQHNAQQGPPPGYNPAPQSPPDYGQQDARSRARAERAQRKANRPFYKKKRFIIPLILVILFIVLVETSGNGSSTSAGGTITPTGPPHAITAHDWQLIAKDPDSHKGESVIVYGQVIQFDAATGTDNFRADVDGVEHPPQNGYADYTTNTVITGDATVLKTIVEKDLFKATVTVAGSISYDTQIGGKTTAPTLQIQSIQITGHSS